MLSLGLCIIVTTLLISSFLQQLCPFLAVYFMGTGLGSCLVCINSMWVGWQWFPHHKGLATGCVMLFFGGSTALQGLFITFLMNPSNELPDYKVTDGDQAEYLFGGHIAGRLPRSFRVMTVVYAIVGITALLFIKERSMSVLERRSVMSSIVSRAPRLHHCPDLRSAFRTSALYILFLYCFTSYCFAGFMVLQYKTYAMTKFRNDQLLSLIGSIGFCFNTITRFLISLLMDYIDFRRVSLAVMTIQILLSVTIHWIVAIPVVYAIWVGLALMCYAAVFSPVTIVCGDIYGPR